MESRGVVVVFVNGKFACVCESHVLFTFCHFRAVLRYLWTFLYILVENGISIEAQFL